MSSIMKKSLIILSMLAAGFVSANATTYYYKGLASGDGKFDVLENWYTDATLTSPATSLPTSADDIVFGAGTVAKNTIRLDAGNSVSKNPEFNSITVTKEATSGLTFVNWVSANKNESLTTKGNFTIEAVESASREVYVKSAAKDSYLDVSIGGNLSIGNGNTAKFGFIKNQYSECALNTFSVGTAGNANTGNVYVTATDKDTWLYIAANSRFDKDASNPDINIMGKLYMSSGEKLAYATFLGGNAWAGVDYIIDRTIFANIGGLQGKGAFYATNIASRDSATDKTSLLTINLAIANNTSNSKFVGTFSSIANNVKNGTITLNKEDVEFNITKTGAYKQEISILDGGFYTNVNNITIKEGELALHNPASSGSFGAITIEDGALGVASANGGDSQIGELNADSITWNGGTINIDINDYAVDIINVESFTKGSADTFKFIFTEGDDKIVEDNAYTILSTLNTDFVSEDFTAEIDGYNAVFNMEDGILSVTFTAVPEPATIACIFGVLSLAFVAYRRRK